ncbi:flagellar hook-basal body complex protein FliE [Kyrpidia tusciae]|uniref:Flagellar hook-basal body complex protein FliE n=1 Tax=Kyrpidia tusciae (strain DSM 2912 / NBRC 15312 / T2) TaxID=562970 RepID=D5WPE7_KYRT2|nr:flagellar hook-basal body complex protein FliE [Kyrpidia tusciae]ADG06206.1 flagellar hook-basal body complex subunit FliE [Kyrpidia tusciae DSM 2912]MBE3553031.1 flagellar hook-basal body complex protein FliE [Kyrpidia tusciae]
MVTPANAIGSVSAALPSATPSAPEPSRPSGGFGELFGRALDQVDALQQRADHIVAQFVAGQGPDVHDVMIAAQQAYLALQTVVQIRDRAVAAYQDIMRMQI